LRHLNLRPDSSRPRTHRKILSAPGLSSVKHWQTY